MTDHPVDPECAEDRGYLRHFEHVAVFRVGNFGLFASVKRGRFILAPHMAVRMAIKKREHLLTGCHPSLQSFKTPSKTPA